MTRIATQWKPTIGRGANANTGTTDYLLSEASEFLLTETDDNLILDSTTIEELERTLWTNPSKNRTSWKPTSSGTSVVTADQPRITQNSDTRITETGDSRVINETVVSGKTPTTWSDS